MSPTESPFFIYGDVQIHDDSPRKEKSLIAEDRRNKIE